MQPTRSFGRIRRVLPLMALTAYAVVGFVTPASAAITQTGDANAIAAAIGDGQSFVGAASFVSVTGTPNATADNAPALAGFPRSGPSYGILTTGDPTIAGDANSSPSSGDNLGGPNVRGNSDYDVTVMDIDLNIPGDRNCLLFDFKFLSEEYPEFVGSSFNDAFIAEIDASTWDTEGSLITAPDNFATDPGGRVVSINTAGASAANSAGTTYDAATQTLTARVPVTAGAHSLFLSIFDQGDQIYDAAAFVDNLRLTQETPGACDPGVIFTCTITGTANNDTLIGTPDGDVICGLGGADKIVGGDGNDILLGNSGNDRITPGEGSDTIIGATGRDTVLFTGTTSVIADLGSGEATGQGDDVMTGIENATGGSGFDKLLGSRARNVLKGGGGGDALKGRKGRDRLLGGPGFDLLNGGPGVDYCRVGGGGGSTSSCEI